MAPVDLSNDTKNWLKAVLALKHLKNGLLPFVDQHISAFHNNLIATYGTCNQCTTENILRCPTKNVCWKNRQGICQYHDNKNPLRQYRPCPNGACDNIRDAIIREHIKGEPMWKNTDAAKWSSDAWEMAKCFLPPGSKNDASSADTDCTGILSLCLHCLPLTTLLVHVTQDFEKNRDNRNILLHSGRQEISDTDRASFIQDAIKLLWTYQTPVDQHTKDCIDTLTEIDSDGLMLTTDDIIGIMEDKVDGIRSKQEEIEVELQETKGNIDVNTDAIAIQQTTLDTYKSGVKKLDDGLKATHSILQRLDVHNDELKKEMENIRTNNEDICKQINDEIEALETKVKTLETHMVTIDSKHDQHHKEYDERHKDHDERHKEHDERYKEQAGILNEHDKRHEEHDERHKKYDERHQEYDERHKDHDERHNEYDERHKEHDERHKEHDERHKEHDERHKDHNERHKEHDERHKEHDERHKEHDERHKEHDERHKEHDERHKEHDERHKEYDERHKEHDERHKEYDERHKEHDERHKDHDERHKEYDERHKEHDERHKDHDERHKEYDERHKEYDERHKEYDERHKEHDERHKEYDERHKEHDERHKEYDERHKELTQRVDTQFAATGQKLDSCLTTVDDKFELVYSRISEEVSNRHQDNVSERSTGKEILDDADRMSATERHDDQKMQGRKHLREYLIKKYRKHYIDVPVAPLKQDMWSDISKHYREQKLKQSRMPGESQIQNVEDETNVTVESYNEVFYRQGTQCRNIYVKGDAGSGKSVFCQHMVSIWCDSYSSDKKQDSPLGCVTPSEKQNDINIEILHQFDFLFYITLRHANHLYDIVSMIKENLLRNNKQLSDQLTYVLENESDKCLILLDGLDEWSPPADSTVSPFVTFGLPDRDDSLDWTFLTTSRPWKLETVRPKRCEIDQMIELLGLTQRSVQETINSVVDYLNNRYIKDVALNKCPAQCFWHLYLTAPFLTMTFPIILNHLVCIWFENGNVGKTQCDIYAAIVNLLIRYADSKTNKNTHSHSNTANECNELPACLNNREICQRLKQPLYKLSKLAFHTLFCKDRTSSLVFDSHTTHIHGMSNAEVEFWLEIGLLSEDSVDIRSTMDEKLVSFHHKTIQEFLAAVYIFMHTEPDNAVLSAVKDACRSLDMVLDISPVFVFLSGMAPAIVSTILRYISQVVSADENTQRYRRTITVPSNSRADNHLKVIQRLMINCIKESLETGLINIEVYIEDIITDDTMLGLSNTENLLRYNKSNILSLSIKHNIVIGIVEPASKSIDMKQWETTTDKINFQHLPALETLKVVIEHQYGEDDVYAFVISIIRACKNTLTTILLDGLKQSAREVCVGESIIFSDMHEVLHVDREQMKCNHCPDPCRLDLSQLKRLQRIHVFDVCVHTVEINTSQLEECEIGHLPSVSSTSCQSAYAAILLIFHGNGRLLRKLTIRAIYLKHDHLEGLLLLVTQAIGLRDVILTEIKCIDCNTDCTCRLDLSRHTQLEKLELQNLDMSEVHINTTELNECIIQSLRLSSCTSNKQGFGEIPFTFHGDCKMLGLVIITDIVLKHEELKQLMMLMKQATEVRKITLNKIKCSDCGCTGCTCRLDLSRHTKLEELEVQELHVSEVHINTTELNVCTIDSLRLSSSMPEESVTEEVPLMFHGEGNKIGLLTLTNIVLKHKEFKQLMMLMTQATGVRKMTLNNIRCSDCCCTGCIYRIDLSRHTRLQKLVLGELYVSEMQINTTDLNTCTIIRLRSSNCTPNEPGSGKHSILFHGSSKTLRNLILTNIVLKHEQLDQLILLVAQATELQDIILNEIECSDNCYAHRLDLSKHTKIRTLILHKLHVSEIHINTQLLILCAIGRLKSSSCTPDEPGSGEIKLMFHGHGSELTHLEITDIAMKHEQFKQLMLLVKQNILLQDIILNEIKCIDCCTGCENWKHLPLFTYPDSCSPISTELGESAMQFYIATLHHLKLTNIALKHEQLEHLMLFVAKATGLHEITLGMIECSDCATHCTSPLDLSQHMFLRQLELYDLDVSEIQINATMLNICTIDRLRLSSYAHNEPISEAIAYVFHGDARMLGYLTLTGIVMKHEQLEQLMLFVAQATRLREITLSMIKCSDCSTSCTSRLDLSQHTDLRQLELHELEVSEVQINTTTLNICTIDRYRPGNCMPNGPGSGNNPIRFHGSGKTLGDLTLTNIALKHEQLEQLMVLLAQATELRHITLNDIKCSNNCTSHAHRLDLSKHTKLLTLNLQELQVSEVHINTKLLIICAIDTLKSSNYTPNELGHGYIKRVSRATLKWISSTPNEPRSGEFKLMFHGHGRNLRYLRLTNIVMKHEQLEQLLMLFVPQTTGLQWLTLGDIKCSDCPSPCTYRLDLTHHNQLIELTDVHPSEVSFNNPELKRHRVGGLNKITNVYTTH